MQIGGVKVETVTSFIFLGSLITADGDYSHEIQRPLLLGRKAMMNLDNVLKSRDIILPTNIHTVKSYGFSSSHVRMWALDHKEGWAMKNWCFQTVVLEKTSESLGQQEIKPVNPDENQPWLFIDCSLEGLMVKLKLQHFVHLMLRANSLEKTLMLGKTESKRRGDRGWDGLMASPTQWTCILDKLREVVKDREA